MEGLFFLAGKRPLPDGFVFIHIPDAPSESGSCVIETTVETVVGRFPRGRLTHMLLAELDQWYFKQKTRLEKEAQEAKEHQKRLGLAIYNLFIQEGRLPQVTNFLGVPHLHLYLNEPVQYPRGLRYAVVAAIFLVKVPHACSSLTLANYDDVKERLAELHYWLGRSRFLPRSPQEALSELSEMCCWTLALETNPDCNLSQGQQLVVLG